MTILVTEPYRATMRRAKDIIALLDATLDYAVDNYPAPYAPYDDNYYTTVRAPLPDFEQFFEQLNADIPKMLDSSAKERAKSKPTELFQLDHQWLGAPSELGVLTALQMVLAGALRHLRAIDGTDTNKAALTTLSAILTAAAVSHGFMNITAGFVPPLLVARWNGSSELVH